MSLTPRQRRGSNARPPPGVTEEGSFEYTTAATVGIGFEAVLKTPETRKKFAKFLDKQNASGIWKFIEGVEHYKSLPGDEERYACAQQMFKTYFGAPVKIHLPTMSVAAKQHICEYFMQTDFSYCPVDLFDDAYNAFMLELNVDYFPKFSKTRTLSKLVNMKSKKDPNFLNKLQSPSQGQLNISIPTPSAEHEARQISSLINENSGSPSPQNSLGTPPEMIVIKSLESNVDVLHELGEDENKLGEEWKLDEMAVQAALGKGKKDKLTKIAESLWQLDEEESSNASSSGGSVPRSGSTLGSIDDDLDDDLSSDPVGSPSPSSAMSPGHSPGYHGEKPALPPRKKSLTTPTSYPEEVFRDLINAMHEKLPRSTIKKNLIRVYHNVFTGITLVSFIESHMKLASRLDALSIATQLLRRKVVVQANNKKSALDYVNDNTHYLYQFPQKKKVVIVGGGFAGTIVANNLKSDFEVVLIDRKPCFEYVMDFPILTVEPESYQKLIQPFNKLQNIKFIKSCVKEITPEGVYVHVPIKGDEDEEEEDDHYGELVDNSNRKKKKVDKKKEFISYDYLVVSTGSRCAVPFPIDSASIKSCVFPYSSKSILDASEMIQQATKIVVIGGGPTGIEIAGEMSHKYGSAHVYLLTSQTILLERECEHAHKSVMKLLHKHKNLTVLTSRRVVEVRNSTVLYRLNVHSPGVTAPTEELHADIIVVCCGVAPRTDMFARHMPYALNEYKRVIVNDKLQVRKPTNMSSPSIMMSSPSPTPITPATPQLVVSSPAITSSPNIKTGFSLNLGGFKAKKPLDKDEYFRNIFAIGDITALPEEKLAQIAMLHANKVCKNIRKLAKGHDNNLHSYIPDNRIQIVSTGPGQAVMVKGSKVLSEGIFSAKIKQWLRLKVMIGVRDHLQTMDFL